jgi:hypothetical protein
MIAIGCCCITAKPSPTRFWGWGRVGDHPIEAQKIGSRPGSKSTLDRSSQLPFYDVIRNLAVADGIIALF